VILLDDADREGERAAIDRWSRMIALKIETVSPVRPFARLVVTSSPG